MNRELVVVGIGLVAMTLHSLDESIAFGAPSGPPWIAQIAIIVLLVALCALHPRLGPWRLGTAALLVLLGAFVVRTGWDAHVQPLLVHGPGATTARVLFYLVGFPPSLRGASRGRQHQATRHERSRHLAAPPARHRIGPNVATGNRCGTVPGGAIR
jgi:hypothetical protein